MIPFIEQCLGLKFNALQMTMKFVASYFGLTPDYTAPD